jgi:hypothetical protein
MINRLPAAAIGATTVILTLALVLAENYLIAAVAVGLGLIWLLLEVYRKTAFTSLFFVAFIGLAAVGSVNREPSGLMVLGIAADLAAWDLSRFLDRLSGFSGKEIDTGLYRRHLYQLAITVGIGWGLALVPMFIRLPMSFVAFVTLTLLATLMLRQAVLGLQQNGRRRGRP